jgi:ATP-dependent DNA helicase
MYQRMMDDILKQIKAGEVSGVQFKERILDKYDIACELVAFSNSHGGKLVVGITGLRHSDTDLDINYDTFVEDYDTLHSCHDTNHDTKRVPLTNKQKDIVNFCSVPRTSREILERAGVVYHTKNIAKYITSLVAAGYLQMTNPDNPTASNQKYKKVNRR